MSVTSITPHSVCLVSETGYVCYVDYASLCVSGVWDWICLLRPLCLALCVCRLRLDMSVTSITRSVCLVSETGYVCYVHYASLCVSAVWDWICLLRPLRLALCVWCLRLDMSVSSITPRSVCLPSETGYVYYFHHASLCVCYVHYASLCVSRVSDWICLLRRLRLSLCIWCLRLDMSVTSITPRSVCLPSETGYVCYVHYALCVSGDWHWICLLRPLRLARCVCRLRLDISVTSIMPRSVCLVSETGNVFYVYYASPCVSSVWDWICLLRLSRLALCVWCLRLDMSVTSITPRSVCLLSETGYVCYVHYALLCLSRLYFCYVHYASLCVSVVWDWICL